MPGSKRNPKTHSPQGGPSKTSRLFASNKTAVRGPLTRESLAADLEDFRRAGGRIEMLGTTRSLHRIGADANAEAVPTPPPVAPSSSRR